MAESREGEIYWHCPDPRAIFPLDEIKRPRSLKQKERKGIYEVRISCDFPGVIRGCADRRGTWISDEIIRSYEILHSLGWAHSVETWRDEKLVGGLYGISIGGAFFGESMFARESDVSKIAFYALVDRMKERKFTLLDSQYIAGHTRRLGAIEIPRDDYLKILEKAVMIPTTFV